MNRFAIFLLFSMFGLIPSSFAQDHKDVAAYNHGELGAFINYFRLNETGNTNLWGVGGRFGLNIRKYVAVEAEMAYDFQRSFGETFTDQSTGNITFQRSNLRVLDGMVGPKFHVGSGPVRIFATVKGGIINFRFDQRPATFDTFFSSVQGLRDENIKGLLYPGGGVEAFAGPIGLRLDVGDEIYFRNGAHNNLRISLGPHIRF